MERAFYDGTRGFSQSYLLSRIVRNAQRSTKVPFFIREIGVNTLRWPKSFSVILQITGPAPFSATLRSLAQVSPQRLPSCRSLSRSSLCHRDRNWPDREYSGADSQWTNPTASGSARVSTPRHFEELSLAFWSQRTPRSGGRSRPTTSGTLLSSGAWDFLKQVLPQASPGQIAFLDRFHAHTGASRWSFLRQKHRPVSRYKAARLWHCGSNVPTVEKPYGRSSIPRVCSRLGSRSVLLHAASVERRTQVCGRAQAHRFGNRRDPATIVHLQKVHLSSSFGNELGADGRGGLAFLLRPGVSRAFAARVQRLVCHGQDSYPQLVGQCRIHGTDPVGLRLGFGFTVSLFARRSSSLEYRYALPRTLVVAGRMDQARQSQPLDASVEVPSPKSLPQNPTCYHQGQGADLNQFATLWIASSVVGERN